MCATDTQVLEIIYLLYECAVWEGILSWFTDLLNMGSVILYDCANLHSSKLEVEYLVDCLH
jgi:hypothetical protein